jgi:transposase
MMDKLYVGIDIAQASFEAAVWQPPTGVALGQFPNTLAGFAQLRQRLQAEFVHAETELQLVLEATGGYELALLAYAYAQDWRLCLPNPKRVRDGAKGSGRRGKTDRQDSLLLAQFGAERQPQPQEALPAPVQALAELLSRRQDLEQLRRSESNRLRSYQQHPQPLAAILDSLQRTLAALAHELSALEQAITALLKQEPELQAQAKRLRTVPGIGAKNVLPILVLLYRWRARAGAAANSKGLVAFLGLDPQPYQSGRTVYQRPTISKQGDRQVRQSLYMGALGGIRGHNPLRTFYGRLVDRGKAKRLALVAAARKIAVWAWVVFSQQVDFDPSRYPQEAPAAT